MKAVVLGFDFNIVNAQCGAKADDPAWVSKYLADLWLMDRDNWDTEGLVSVISVTEIDEATLNEMKQAGNNPYVILGLLDSEGNVCLKDGIPVIGNLTNGSKSGQKV